MFPNQRYPRDSFQTYNNPCFNAYYPINPIVPVYNRSSDINYQPNYAYPPHFIYNQPKPENTATVTLEKRQEDEKIFETFIQSVEQAGEECVERNLKKSSKIAHAKKALKSVSKLNKLIESVCGDLKNNLNITEEEWQEKIVVCNQAKQEIHKLLQTIKDPDFLCDLKKDLQRRKKKRLRESIKKEKWKNEKKLQVEKTARLHIEADSWIRSKQAEIDREKQEENLRRDADMILSDVRGKRSDTRKYLGLLQELQNLRNVKINVARARGEHLSLAADEAFNNIITRLTDQWTALDREYSIEEQGLKLMLKTDNDKRIEKQKKNILDDWENTLFGAKLLSNQAHNDIHEFVTNRFAWDRYISSESGASPIPIGWIVPKKPSSAAWQNYLKKGQA